MPHGDGALKANLVNMNHLPYSQAMHATARRSLFEFSGWDVRKEWQEKDMSRRIRKNPTNAC